MVALRYLSHRLVGTVRRACRRRGPGRSVAGRRRIGRGLVVGAHAGADRADGHGHSGSDSDAPRNPAQLSGAGAHPLLLRKIRPEIRQYFIESDQDEEPFSREDRSIVYQRSKSEEAARPFGTKKSVYEGGYAWMTHSIVPTHLSEQDFRVRIGGPDCAQPYDASLYNVSAMSFGSLSGAAIEAINKGAARGRVRAGHGRGRDQQISPQRRRSDLGNRIRLFRLPHR